MGYPSPRTSKHRFVLKRGLSGLGLFAADPIKRGEFLIEYRGELITNEEADRRGGKYLFQVDKNMTIDGKTRTNTARYINHSCKPNCEPEEDGTRVFIYAKRAIAPGEELTYDYGKEYWDDYMGPRGCKCAACRAGRGRSART